MFASPNRYFTESKTVVNKYLICSFCFYYHLLLLFICLRVGVISAGCRQISNSPILEFSQPLWYLYPAMQTRKTFSIALINCSRDLKNSFIICCSLRYVFLFHLFSGKIGQSPCSLKAPHTVSS